MNVIQKSARAGRVAGRLGTWAGGVLGTLAAMDRRHRDHVRLAALPDHLLADIGVTRDAVRGPGRGLDGC